MTSFIVPLLLALTITLAHGQVCFHQQLGLSLQFCQPCGSPGLDDFCVKRYGTCGNYQTGGYNLYGLLGGGSGLPPHGYLSSGTLPATCNTILAAANAIPNRALVTGTVPVYNQAGFFANYGATKIPRVSVNPMIHSWLRIDRTNIHHCLENNVPKHPYGPNSRWNTVWSNPRVTRLDSFYYEDIGNNTWSYQCYCDFCHACQSC